MKRRQGGFSLLELVVALVVIIVLATGSYLRYMDLVIDAERAAFKGGWGWLRAGVNMEMSEALGSGGFDSLSELEQTNPMALVLKVMEPPSNYLGELKGRNAEKSKPGHWYYDLDQRLLIYHVRYNQNLQGFMEDSYNRLKFKLKVVRRDADNSVGAISRNPVTGLKLLPVDEEFWSTPLSYGRKLELDGGN
ncbi:MAG: prepilin-type N-terminal cleavage/methylation domain-containing protein [Motiliproteus sp.]|nr:prepilin-type N-terminal cleavage/methylation domain-containing protein [Motiliproteus sp.]MCW9050889.1 prepilin-type N-terminal cleavage/methylation domain-containing protein [Motiliproteus sp.]